MDVLRFGVYEAHLGSAELYKNGRLVRLQLQPFEVLRALLQRPGELVTRESLRRTLWADGVTVDFDQSLNKCVTKLRDALGDTATSPRFIETLPKRGYRFIAPVTAASVRQPTDEPTTTPAGAVGLGTLDIVRQRSARRLWIPVGLLVATAATAVVSIGLTKPVTGVEARAERATPPKRVATGSPIFAARDAYERGRLALARRSDESLRLSVEHFARAIALSPRYAEAYVGLADGWSLMSSYGLVDPREGMPRAREAANRALTLDPNLARAHATLGRATMIFDWDWRTAEWHFARALELEPGLATTHQWRAYLFSALGRHEAAIDEARRAIAAEPLSLNTNTALGFVLYLARRYDEASSQLERTLEIGPDFTQARRDLALVRVQQHRYPEALYNMQRVSALNDGSPVAMAELAWVYAIRGEHATARRMLATLDRMRATSFVPPDSLAMVYAGLGDGDAAIAWLQHAFTMRVAALAHVPIDPVWDGLREDPRVVQMTEAIGGGR